MSDYYARFNPDLLALIPPDAKAVLEIGCGAGALCEAYRRINPGVYWVGVEVFLEACDEARKPGRLDSVFPFDLDRVVPCALADHLAKFNDEFDCLICGNVLEHLRDPWLALKSLVEHITPGAQVLASIPNVQHWTVIRDLLAGHWRYTDEGLLDRTHLRFFTLESIRELFKDAGLQVHEIRGRDICNEGLAKWVDDNEWITEVSSLSQIPKEWRAYQYIVRALKPNIHCTITRNESNGDKTVTHSGPADVTPKLHIHAITAEDCCARPRIHEPFKMLATIPGVKCTVGRNLDTVNPDIHIQQRARNIDIELQRILVASGAMLVAEIDDLPEAIGMDPMALKAVHAVQCSTEALAEVCRQYNPNVMVFPNQIAELPPFDRPKTLPNDDTVRIFFGAQNREADWKPIMPALLRVLEEYRDRVYVHVVHDREFYDAIPEFVVNKEFAPFCEYSEYRRILGRCHIALLPLEPTPFNECKSDLKFLECAAEGCVPLMGITAAKAIDEGCAIGMFYVSEPGALTFEYTLRQLIEGASGMAGAECRRILAEKYYRYVCDHRLLSQHYRKRYDWYLSLINSKQELHRDLLERCPELTREPQSLPARSAILS